MTRLIWLSLSLLLLLAPKAQAQTWPNEPAGSTVINDMPFSCVVCNGWVDYSSATSLASDGTAPSSPPSVLRQTFSAGLQGGFGGGGGNAYNFGQLYDDVYFGYWFKVDNNYVNHIVGTKISWIHTDASLLNELFLFMEGSGPYIISAQYQNTYADNSHIGGPSPYGSVRFGPNGGSFSKNQWVRIEQYFKPATCLTCRNGIWKVWANGQLIHNITTLNTKDTTRPGAVSFITIWGGVTQTMPSDSYLYWDHAHVSIPNCSGGCGGGGGTTPPSPTPPPPTGNPGTVSNLAVVPQSSTTALVSFSAVDDGTGSPAKYDNRLAPAPINWGATSSIASGACASPFAPAGVIGSTVTCLLTGLTPGQSYQLQNVAFRGTMNAGAIYGSLGNVASFTMPSSNVPAITNFTPASGATGVSVTITGSNFGASIGGNTVKFNGQTATVTSASTTSLTVTAPDGVTTGKVSVQTDQGIVYSEQNFTVGGESSSCGCS